MSNKITKTITAIPKTKVGGFTLWDAFITAGLKSVSEQTLIPIMGNSTYKSGFLKIISALIVPSAKRLVPQKWDFARKAIKLEAAALAIDGTEDIARALLMGSNGNKSEVM